MYRSLDPYMQGDRDVIRQVHTPLCINAHDMDLCRKHALVLLLTVSLPGTTAYRSIVKGTDHWTSQVITEIVELSLALPGACTAVSGSLDLSSRSADCFPHSTTVI